MRNTMHTQLRVGFLILAMALFGLGMLPGTVHAAVNCGTASFSTDADRDGLSDAEECNGITLSGGQGLVFADAAGSYPNLNTQGSTIPSCGPSSIRRNCLDPNTPDVFVMLVLQGQSSIPLACWSFTPINRPPTDALGGLGVTTHIILPNPNTPQNRLVTTIQNAVQLAESADTSDGDFGQTDWGAPNNALPESSPGTPFIVSFPNRIDTYLNKNGVTDQASHISVKCRNVAHELGHSLGLIAGALWNPSYGTYHYKTGSGYLMDQHIQVKGGRVIAPTKITSTEPGVNCRTKILAQGKTGTCVPFSPDIIF